VRKGQVDRKANQQIKGKGDQEENSTQGESQPERSSLPASLFCRLPGWFCVIAFIADVQIQQPFDILFRDVVHALFNEYSEAEFR